MPDSPANNRDMPRSDAPKIDARAVRRTQLAQEQRARTRAAILDATFQVIGHEHGRLARIEDVVRVARIARPTFYTYFSSMEELFAALSFELSHEFNTKVLSYASRQENAAAEGAFAIRYYLERAAIDPKWGWGMVNLSVGGPIFGADTYAAATSTVQWGVDSGIFRIADVRIGRDMVLGTGLAAMKTILTSEREPSYPAQVARQVLMGLGVSAAKAEKLVDKPLPVLIGAVDSPGASL
ncbi:MAG: TetR/AcrR family transcriptional regulator [Pseudomonadota bacterium]